MGEVRVVSMNGLRDRLRDVLGETSPLFAVFALAIDRHDEELIQEAMDGLAACPEPLRGRAQDAMLSWLFDPNDDSGLADLPTAGGIN